MNNYLPINKDNVYQQIYRIVESGASYLAAVFPRTQMTQSMELVIRTRAQERVVKSFQENAKQFTIVYGESQLWQTLPDHLKMDQALQYVVALYGAYESLVMQSYDFNIDMIFKQKDSLFIMDFGLDSLAFAQAYHDNANVEKLYQATQPPEQLRGKFEVSKSWGLGVLLLQMMSSRRVLQILRRQILTRDSSMVQNLILQVATHHGFPRQITAFLLLLLDMEPQTRIKWPAVKQHPLMRLETTSRYELMSTQQLTPQPMIKLLSNSSLQQWITPQSNNLLNVPRQVKSPKVETYLPSRRSSNLRVSDPHREKVKQALAQKKQASAFEDTSSQQQQPMMSSYLYAIKKVSLNLYNKEEGSRHSRLQQQRKMQQNHSEPPNFKSPPRSAFFHNNQSMANTTKQQRNGSVIDDLQVNASYMMASKEQFFNSSKDGNNQQQHNNRYDQKEEQEITFPRGNTKSQHVSEMSKHDEDLKRQAYQQKQSSQHDTRRNIKQQQTFGVDEQQSDSPQLHSSDLQSPQREAFNLHKLIKTEYVAAHTVAAHTVPTHTVPAHTVPAHTVPAHTVPAHTVPAHTVPAHTVPAHTDAAHTLAARTVPAYTVPAHNVPTHTVAAHTVAAHNVPAHNVPAQTVAVQAQPPITKGADPVPMKNIFTEVPKSPPKQKQSQKLQDDMFLEELEDLDDMGQIKSKEVKTPIQTKSILKPQAISIDTPKSESPNAMFKTYVKRYTKYLQQINVIGDMVAQAIELLEANKNIWIIPLFLIFKRMSQLRLKVNNDLDANANPWRLANFDAFRNSPEYMTFKSNLVKENEIVQKELSEIMAVARKRMTKLDQAGLQKMEPMINLNMDADIKDSVFVYLYSQVYARAKQNVKSPSAKFTVKQCTLLQLRIQSSLIILELPLYDDQEFNKNEYDEIIKVEDLGRLNVHSTKLEVMVNAVKLRLKTQYAL